MRRSSACTRRTTGSSGSPATPRTSSARPWRPCSARSRWRSAATARRRSTGGSWSGSATRATRLRQIVESLLLLAQPGGRPARASRWWTSRAGCPTTSGRWSAHPRAADLRARVDDRAPLVVRVHPPLLAQLVDNLLENACKYSAPGTPIVVRVWREGGSVAPGRRGSRAAGLTADEVARVFEPFFRGEQARRDGHAGRRPGPGRGASDRRDLRRDARSPERAGSGEPLHPPPARGATDGRPASSGLSDCGLMGPVIRRSGCLTRAVSACQGCWPIARLSRNWARL